MNLQPSLQASPVRHAQPAGATTLVLTIGGGGREDIQHTLAEAGFHTWAAPDRVDLHSLLELREWALVLLHVPCPGPGSLERCSQVRAMYGGPMAALTPVLDEDLELALRSVDMDDVLAWPGSPRLLVARLCSLLHRDQQGRVGRSGYPQAPIRLADLIIDPARREVRRGSRVIPLTDTELELLQLLVRNLGCPVSRDEIFQELRGFPYDGLDRSIDLRVSRLRRKLSDGSGRAGLILTVRGVGYQLAAAAV